MERLVGIAVLEEDGTFGEGRCFLPEGQCHGKPVNGVGRKETVTCWILDWTQGNGWKPVPRALGHTQVFFRLLPALLWLPSAPHPFPFSSPAPGHSQPAWGWGKEPARAHPGLPAGRRWQGRMMECSLWLGGG